MSNPSLILPQSPAYGEDYVYAAQVEDGAVPLYNVLPLTFTRASGGTRINKDGLVQNMPYNLVEQSETFDSATWQKSGINVTANAVANPLNGQTTADNLVADTGNNFHYIFQALTYPTNVVTMYVYVKANGYNWFVIDTGITGSYYNISTGTLGTTAGGGTASIQSVGNGWYRCGLTFTGNPSSAGVYLSVRTANNGGSFTGDGVSGILTYGAQLNIGSTAQPYLATTDRLNMPRITYPVGGGCGALLLEKQSTNVFTYSEQFDDASWVKFNSSISTNTTTSPDGTSNADSLIENTGNTDHGFYKFAPTITTALGAVTISCFIKSNGRRVQIKNSYTTDASNFDLQNGVVVSNVGSGVGEIQNIGNGWYRCILKTTANASGNAGLTLSLLDNSNNIVYTGNGTSGVFIWGAQIEVSSYATSYIPTTSTSATRIQDVCYKTGISNLIGTTAGTMYININNPNPSQYLGVPPANTIFASINSGDYLNNFHFTTDNGNIYVYCNASGGALQAAIGTTMPTTSKIKMAVTYTSSAIKFFLNGVLVGTDTSFTLPSSMSRVDIGHMGGQPDSQRMRGSVNDFQVYTSALTDSEAIALTTL